MDHGGSAARVACQNTGRRDLAVFGAVGLLRTATPTSSFALIVMCEAILARIASLARMLSRALRLASAVALPGFRSVRRSDRGDRHC
jgi:hypothetical protein